jgi:hypothetical protein
MGISMAANPEAASPDVVDPAADEQVDGCPAGSGIDAAEATPDDQLPAVSGGVAALPASAANEDHADACDPAAGAADSTADQELPAAAGGVA